ncbi:MAG: hypothetical protein Q7S54_01340 [bacterium]|nr:hypothetical protein [bacterium]
MPPENNPPQNSPSSLKQIRTFQGDVAEALGRQKESLVSIQQTEQFKKRLEPALSLDSEIAKKRRNFFFLLVGSFFFIWLGLMGAWFGYREYERKTAPPVISVPLNRFISPESTASLDLSGSNATRDGLITVFDSAVFGLASGELRQIILKNGAMEEAPLIETPRFFEIIGSQAPGSLIRALDPAFMIGALGESRFIIFKISSFANAFSGMLAWEPALAEDLGPLLGKAELLKVSASASVFKDMVVRNKDVRVLEPILLYSFLDNEKLIITDKIETLQTLIERLTREKLSR